MGKFRISIGGASCIGYDAKSTEEKVVCEHVLAKLEQLKLLSFKQLKDFSEENFEHIDVHGVQAALTIYKKDLSAGSILVVVQAFLPTWKFPTYFSFGGVGKIFADGIVVSTDNQKSTALSEQLLSFR